MNSTIVGTRGFASGVRIVGRNLAILVGTLALAVSMVVAPGGVGDAAQAQPFDQCNEENNTPGLEIRCDVVITNTLDLSTGATGSVVVMEKCTGAAATPGVCTTSTVTSIELVDSVAQCNGSVNGGGANVMCTVSVVNNITGAANVTPATINQCQGSAGGGGTEPVLVCNPLGVTTNATIDQCNGSANGGGGAARVICTVNPSTQAAELPVTINQCNGSANGGGSTVTCEATLTTNVVPAAPIDDGTDDGGGTPGDTPGDGSGTPDDGGTPGDDRGTPDDGGGTPATPGGDTPVGSDTPHSDAPTTTRTSGGSEMTGGSGEATGTLAATGSAAAPTLVFGAVLLALGTLLMTRGRRTVQ